MARVLISGAGISGLTSALWFERQGHDVMVIERAASIRGGGFLVSLSDYAYRAAAELGVLEAFRERDMGITHSSYHNMAGTNLLALDYKDLFNNVDVLQIMRDDVVDVLYSRAKAKVEMRFAETIDNLEHESDVINISFASGEQETFDLLVVAEGQNSPTRQLLVGEDTKLDYLGLHCAAMKVPNVLGLEGKFETHMDVGRYMAVFNSPDGSLGTVFVWSNTDLSVPHGENKLAALKVAFENSSTAIAQVLDCASANDIYMDSLKQVVAERWHAGRAICVGDAAHCLTLFSGRGAAAAISGPTRLAKQIEAQGVAAGLKQYERDMREIMEPIQKQTRRAVSWYVPQTNWQRYSRDLLMRSLPNRLFQLYFQMKYSNV